VDAKPAKLIRLRAAMHRVIDPAADSILICSLGPLADRGMHRIEYLGRQRRFTGHDALIV
jgi:CRISPR-associated protein Cas2